MKITTMPAILSPKLLGVHEAIQTSNTKAIQLFWSQIEAQGAPIIEPGKEGHSLVTFLWRDNGSTRNVAVIQDWGADGIREHFMTRLPGSDVWYLTRTMRSDTRTSYQLSPSPFSDRSKPAPYRLDPLNPKTLTAFLSENGQDILFSLLELPDAPALPWRQASLARRGDVQLHRPLADRRWMWVYLPPIRVSTALPMVLVLDGRLYKDQLKFLDILDYLIDRGDIPPTAALLLDNVDRSELNCKPEFADYIANQVIPWFRGMYPVTNQPTQTVVLGSSFGGLAAVYLAFQYPNIFGTVLSQTGWFRWHPEGDPSHHWLARQLTAAPKLPLRFWLQVGNLEVAQMADGGPDQLEANQYMRDTLQARGYFVSYQEYSGGHDFSSLEYPLAQAVVEIFK